ncbi:uncharacterized protein LOC142897332 isoform X2 [Nelusetta ayraudi]|uniref:uncharacterized protein LOC142897332 isoform X2 n=1 Tax=Nelusetta ayraudi TaxID=303726 RepID=UPI003F72F761
MKMKMKMKKMMEAKVFAALCALLIINFGSADHVTGEPVVTPTPEGSDGSSANHVVTSQHLNDSDTGPNPGDTNSLSNTTMVEEKNGTVKATLEEDSGSNIVNTSVTATPEPNVTQPSPPSPPAASNTSTTGVPLNSSSTVNQPDHSDRLNVAVTAAPSANASTDSGNHMKANLSTEVTSPEPPKMEPTTAAATNASTTVPPASSPAATTSTTITTTKSSTTQISATKSASPTPLHSTSQTMGPHQGQTTARPSSTTTQGKGHAASPSQLNVNAKKMPDSPTLDPLLAALVSAFIIAAVIIILLLFLKLRKRGNQPEFRRLQDLPMDDMMEDTPLSMYSY